MGTYIQIDSICIDLTNYMDNTDSGKCEHFSLRGYVSEMRKKDWKKCWPFPVNQSEEKPSLPPLDVPKFRWWACESCRQATATEGTDKDDRIDLNCSNNGCGSASNCGNAVINSGIQQAPMADSTLVTREIDLNIPIDLSIDSDFEIENNAEVLPRRITDPAIGFENKSNHQVSSVRSPKVCPSLVQEVKRDKQCQKELRESCVMLTKGTTVTQQDNVAENSTGHFPSELVVGSDVVPTGNTDKIVNNDSHVHHPERSVGLSRKRPRKMRLMTDILSENGDSKTEQIVRNGSTSHLPSNASATLKTLSILPDKVDVQGDNTLTKRGQGRKRKLLLDEESERPANMCYQRIESEVKNLKASSHITNALSGKGKGVILEEINGARNKDKAAEVMELGGMKRFYDLTMEESDQGTIDDVPMEVVEIMARNQYERSLPDVHQGREASHPWPTLGYEVVPRKAVSQPSKSSMDLISLRCGSLHKEIEKKNFDINCPYFNEDNVQNPGRNIGHGSLERTNAKCAIKAHQNPRGSFDMHSNDAILAMHLLGLMDVGKQSTTSLNAGVRDQMLKRPLYPGECSTKLDIGKSKTHGSKKRLASNDSNESDGNLEKSAKKEKLSNCTININPTDFHVLDEGNAYMINGRDLIFEDNVPENRTGLPTPHSCRLKRNQKGKMKVHEKKD